MKPICVRSLLAFLTAIVAIMSGTAVALEETSSSEGASTEKKASDLKTEWTLLKPEGLGFSVRVPKIVKPETKTSDLVKLNQWLIETESNRYLIQVFDASEAGLQPEGLFNQGVAKQYGDELKALKHNGMKGWGRTQVFPKGKVYQMFFANGKFLYTFMSRISDQKIEKNQFFNSIQVDPIPAWKKIDRPDLKVSFQFPFSKSQKIEKSEFSDNTTWVSGGDLMYLATAVKLNQPVSLEKREKELKTLATEVMANGDNKFLGTASGNGIIKQEYSFIDKHKNNVRLNAYTADGFYYVFMIGGPELKNDSKQVKEYFESIKISAEQ